MRCAAALLLLALLCATVDAGNRCEWAVDFLHQCGFPVTSNTILAMLGWQTCEGTSCRNNPLDTTQPWSGATNCNSVGVKNYPNCAAGLAASKSTLFNGYYKGIINAFAANQDAMSIAAQIAGSPWGSHCAVSTTSYCASHRSTCCNAGVAGDCSAAAAPDADGTLSASMALAMRLLNITKVSGPASPKLAVE